MFADLLVTEFLKLRRAKVTWFTLAALSMGLLGLSLFMWIVRQPGRAARLGLLGAKANLAGLEATWPSYASMLTLLVGMGGLIVLSFVVAYVFGREYAEDTAKNLLALPVARHWVVIAKLAVSAVWWLALVVAVLVEALVIGLALGLPGFGPQLALSAAGHALLAAAIAFLLVPVIAWVTVTGRGYMPALGFAIAALALGNVISKTGWATYFPWSVVPTLVGMLGKPVSTLPAASYVVLTLTFLAGVGGTIHAMHRDETG